MSRMNDAQFLAECRRLSGKWHEVENDQNVYDKQVDNCLERVAEIRAFMAPYVERTVPRDMIKSPTSLFTLTF